ncbi:MAG: hypothetical protein ACLR7D_09905 [Lachnospira eligens]
MTSARDKTVISVFSTREKYTESVIPKGTYNGQACGCDILSVSRRCCLRVTSRSAKTVLLEALG